MTVHDDLDTELNSYLREGPTELPYESFDAVRDRMEQTSQRAVIGLWRVPDMNKFLAIGAGAAAVVVAVIIGAQLLGSPGGIGADPTASATPEPTPEPTPLPSAAAGLTQGPYLITGTDGANDGGPVQITVDIATPGWEELLQFDALTKGDDGLDAPETVGAALIGWAWPVGTEFHVYGDPCQWSSTIPETPATTPDEIAAALEAQAQVDATAPIDVTVGGYTGKAITLTVPMSYEVPGATREEKFADCTGSEFAYYGIEGDEGTLVMRNAQGPGQVDELWILDVDGSIVILNAVHSPATPADLVEELRAMAESATFEAP